LAKNLQHQDTKKITNKDHKEKLKYLILALWHLYSIRVRQKANPRQLAGDPGVE